MPGIKRDKASEDPPATPGSERPNKPSHKRNTDEQPTGTPTSDRHGTETVHHWEDGRTQIVALAINRKLPSDPSLRGE